MDDLKATATATPADKAVSGFVLRDKGDKVTLYKVGKKSMMLNHSDKELDMNGLKVKVATQEQLKEMYDADASYAKFVTPPSGYKAPWHKS